MHNTLQVFQLNIRKQSTVQQSVMNDEELKEFGVLALSEPYVRRKDGMLSTVPTGSDVFGIEEPLSIFSIYIEDIDFLNIDSSI